MRIRIIKPGIFTTIQDEGRTAYLARAVPVSGCVDQLSARVANMAVGNNRDAALLEFTYADASFVTETDALISHSGDGASLFNGEYKIPANRPVFLPANTEISLKPAGGSRTYVAIAGGWQAPVVMTSRSTYVTAGFGGLNGQALKADTLLESLPGLNNVSAQIINSLKGTSIKSASWSIARQMFLSEDVKSIRIIPAHEFNWFTGNSILQFLSSAYIVSRQSNRMGCQLDGPAIERSVKEELLSTAVTPGTIQINGAGQPILLLADCQTTGGYPRIAQIAAVDLPLCGQLKPGDAITFKEISRQEAEDLYLEQQAELQQTELAIKSNYL